MTRTPRKAWIEDTKMQRRPSTRKASVVTPSVSFLPLLLDDQNDDKSLKFDANRHSTDMPECLTGRRSDYQKPQVTGRCDASLIQLEDLTKWCLMDQERLADDANGMFLIVKSGHSGHIALQT